MAQAVSGLIRGRSGTLALNRFASSSLPARVRAPEHRNTSLCVMRSSNSTMSSLADIAYAGAPYSKELASACEAVRLAAKLCMVSRISCR